MTDSKYWPAGNGPKNLCLECVMLLLEVHQYVKVEGAHWDLLPNMVCKTQLAALHSYLSIPGNHTLLRNKFCQFLNDADAQVMKSRLLVCLPHLPMALLETPKGIASVGVGRSQNTSICPVLLQYPMGVAHPRYNDQENILPLLSIFQDFHLTTLS